MAGLRDGIRERVLRRKSGGERPSRGLAQGSGPRPEGRPRFGDFVAAGEKGRGLSTRARSRSPGLPASSQLLGGLRPNLGRLRPGRRFTPGCSDPGVWRGRRTRHFRVRSRSLRDLVPADPVLGRCGWVPKELFFGELRRPCRGPPAVLTSTERGGRLRSLKCGLPVQWSFRSLHPTLGAASTSKSRSLRVAFCVCKVSLSLGGALERGPAQRPAVAGAR